MCASHPSFWKGDSGCNIVRNIYIYIYILFSPSRDPPLFCFTRMPRRRTKSQNARMRTKRTSRRRSRATPSRVRRVRVSRRRWGGSDAKAHSKWWIEERQTARRKALHRPRRNQNDSYISLDAQEHRPDDDLNQYDLRDSYYKNKPIQPVCDTDDEMIFSRDTEMISRNPLANKYYVDSLMSSRKQRTPEYTPTSPQRSRYRLTRGTQEYKPTTFDSLTQRGTQEYTPTPVEKLKPLTTRWGKVLTTPGYHKPIKRLG